ncbi:heavy metal translocating P-type ATPase [soil metagenome]
MLKKIRTFFREYRQLAFVIIAIITALGLQLSGNQPTTNWVLGISSSIMVIFLIKDMIQTLREGSVGVDVLAATAIITAVVLGEYWAAMVIVLMLTGGEALEDYAEARAQSELTSLLKRKPTKTRILRNGKRVDIAVNKVQTKDKVIVLPGEVIPVDGAIINGISNVDESSLTGESLPVLAEKGATVLSGSVNLDGELTIEATQTASNSQYEQIIRLVKSAQASKAPFVRMADRFAVPFTLVSYLIAGSAWFVSGDPVRFLQVLVVATPCPLILGAPIALISGMSRTAKHGIIVRTGSAMERLAEIETIAFDKTGTLTVGAPTVEAVHVYKGYKKQDVLTYAAALEQSSTHILAKAIVEHAESKKVSIKKAKHIRESSGHGMIGRMNGKTVAIGRLSFLDSHGIDIPAELTTKTPDATTAYIAFNDSLVGHITFSDKVRPEAKSMLERLKKAGIKHTMMVTGDAESVAQKIAKKLGIEKVVANCLPGDKIIAIEQAQNRPVAFVGDGVNDAPVLTASDVGIALGARGSTAASESADVVIMLDDVGKVADSVEIANRTFAIARQSILIGIFISIGLMAVFWTGRFSPLQGAFLQEIVDIIVIINALRAHGAWQRRKKSTFRKTATA